MVVFVMLSRIQIFDISQNISLSDIFENLKTIYPVFHISCNSFWKITGRVRPKLEWILVTQSGLNHFDR